LDLQEESRIMIEISNIYKTYAGNDLVVDALNGVSLNVASGEIFGVVGPSGAGKSTLIRCVNLLERPTSGTIEVDGQDLTALPAAELRKARQHIGMIFQHFNLLSSRTVAGNIAFPLEITGVGAKEREARTRELLELVGLTEKANAYPAQLSGGQKQRVGIARALATEPKVLLSDEATSALDPQNTTATLELLRDLNHRLGLTILLITHEMNVVRQICDRVAVLQEGRIIEEGTVGELVAKPESLLSKAIFPPIDAPTVLPGATRAAITFMGNLADQPILTSLVRKFNVDVNILGGSIQNIGGGRVGRLQVELSGDQVKQALAYLKEIGLKVELQ
jgi:D-methionine transport system ATP-binding protein